MQLKSDSLWRDIRDSSNRREVALTLFGAIAGGALAAQLGRTKSVTMLASAQAGDTPNKPKTMGASATRIPSLASRIFRIGGYSAGGGVAGQVAEAALKATIDSAENNTATEPSLLDD